MAGQDQNLLNTDLHVLYNWFNLCMLQDENCEAGSISLTWAAEITILTKLIMTKSDNQGATHLG